MKKIFLILLFIFFLFFQPYAQSADNRSITIKPKQGEDVALPYSTKYYAIVIGNNNYKHLPKLKTAIADAKSVDDILKNRYGFETKLLIDATRYDILNHINEFRKRLGESDSFLIYYAGHGEFDKTADKAYWLPVDAERDSPANWIIADDITSNIKRIVSGHILIVSDSCYSGTLTRSVSTELSTKGERGKFLKKMMEKPSRTLMASGGNEPVADEGGGGHSVFASAFLKALEETEKDIFTAEELFHGGVKEIVAGKSDQVPEYNNIKNSGHEGGDFVFQLKIASLGEVSTPAPSASLPSQPEPKITNEDRLFQATEWFEKGYQHDLKKEYDAAIEAYTKAIALNPSHADIYYNRGTAYYYKGQYDRAIEDYNKSIALNPNHADVYYNRGLVYYDKGQYDRTIEDYNKSIALNPNHADVYYNRGLAYYDKGQYDRAIEDYSKAIALNPNYALAYYNRGLAYDNKGEYDRAIENYSKTIALDPNYTNAYNNRGAAYYDKGQYDRAIEDYSKAIALNPNYALPYYNRGLAYENKREYKMAISDFQKNCSMGDKNGCQKAQELKNKKW